MTCTPIHNSFTTDLSAAPNGGDQVFQVIVKSGDRVLVPHQDVYFTYAVKDLDKWHVMGWDWVKDCLAESKHAVVLAWRHCDLPPQNQAAVALSFAT